MTFVPEANDRTIPMSALTAASTAEPLVITPPNFAASTSTDSSEDPIVWACADDVFIDASSAAVASGHVYHLQSWQPEWQCRSNDQDPRSPSFLIPSQHSEFRTSKPLPCQKCKKTPVGIAYSRLNSPHTGQSNWRVRQSDC